MIIDLMAAAQAAVFAKLDGHEALTDLAPVFDHVPQGTKPPMTIIGVIETSDIGGKGGQLEQISVEVLTVYRGESRAQLFAIMLQQRIALDGQALEHAGVAFDTPEWIGAGTDGPAKDGVTYAGTQTFIINAEPA